MQGSLRPGSGANLIRPAHSRNARDDGNDLGKHSVFKKNEGCRAITRQPYITEPGPNLMTSDLTGPTRPRAPHTA